MHLRTLLILLSVDCLNAGSATFPLCMDITSFLYLIYLGYLVVYLNNYVSGLSLKLQTRDEPFNLLNVQTKLVNVSNLQLNGHHSPPNGEDI